MFPLAVYALSIYFCYTIGCEYGREYDRYLIMTSYIMHCVVDGDVISRT